ncbi:MAG: DUF1818 family protein [Elainella sp. Prado103]|jgi:hypothetical protein|nr:DUF1818 family protein [Elainella sp. Prado103]
MAKQIKSGAGWRLGWSTEPIPFQGLVGTDDWAIELTAAELEDFCRLALQLSQTMEQMQTELMDEERLSCEAESDRLWMEVEGFPQAYRLRLILLSGRRAEGEWPEAVIPALLQAIQTLKVF